jgi:MtrB/PioB family decaheme-associated outer membrane protein
MGSFIVSGEAEVTGLPRGKSGKDSKFEEYRDLPETVVVPDLQLMIGGKKEDFFLEFDSTKPGLDDQNFRLRFGRYGLLDLEFEWDQIPHFFSDNVARTPYSRNGGTYTLSTKPNTTAGTDVRDWINDPANTRTLDLRMLQGLARFRVRYTPSPGWTFTGGYFSQNVDGKRAFGAVNGPSPGSYNISELPEPLDYQTHNIELGGEYAGKGWSVGLRYNASLFHNGTSTLVWDNPINLTNELGGVVVGPCNSTSNYLTDGTGGPCQGRIDLYPNNQAHTVTLSGTAALPMKSRFMGTVSYGWRLQDDKFLPFTINPAVTQPALPARDLDGDVRPFMINATLSNNFFDRLNLKTFYRLYDLNNRSRKVFFEDGIIVNDQGSATNLGLQAFPYEYTKHNIGAEAGYDFARWLSAKFSYLWEKMHRESREVLNANEHSFGPTVDIKPNPWMLLRMGYRHFIRDADGYDAGRYVVVFTEETPEDLREEKLEQLRKFDEAARRRDKFSLFTQISPLQNLTFHAGFDMILDRYPDTAIGTQNDNNYSPSIGVVYAPLDWLSLFADYNFEYFDWKMTAMERTAVTQTPALNPDRIWVSRGIDKINTFTVGSEMRLIPERLGFRFHYSFSDGRSEVRAKGSTCAGCTAATDYPTITNHWHEVLARFEYMLHKNVSLRFGYYFNRYSSRDFGVDIMKPWMGDVDTGANVQRSIFLGDQIKQPYTAHIGFIGVRLRF